MNEFHRDEFYPFSYSTPSAGTTSQSENFLAGDIADSIPTNPSDYDKEFPGGDFASQFSQSTFTSIIPSDSTHETWIQDGIDPGTTINQSDLPLGAATTSQTASLPIRSNFDLIESFGATRKGKRSLLQQTDNKKTVACPIFEAEKATGHAHKCAGFEGQNMSDLRRHINRSHRDQVPFLKLCPTCNQDILDQGEFERSHGFSGEHCNNPRKQRRGFGVEEQWRTLYRQLSPVEVAEEASADHLASYVHPNLSMRIDAFGHFSPLSAGGFESTITDNYLLPGVQTSRHDPDEEHEEPEIPDILHCPRKDCDAQFSGNYRKGNVARHLRAQHGDGGSTRIFECEEKGCVKRFGRKDARLKHYRRHHPGLVLAPPQVRKALH